MDELFRIEQEYYQSQQHFERVWTYFNPVNIYYLQEYEAYLLATLQDLHLTNHIQEMRILDLGCGRGNELAKWLFYGAQADNLYGLDLLNTRIQKAKITFPQLNFIQSSAHEMPYPDEHFDIIFQKTVFSSILDPELREQIIQELQRVLKPNGIIIWYDIKPNHRLYKLINRFCQLLTHFTKTPHQWFQLIKRKLMPSKAVNNTGALHKVTTKPISAEEIKVLMQNLKCISINYLGFPYSLIENQILLWLFRPFKHQRFLSSHIFAVYRKPE